MKWPKVLYGEDGKFDIDLLHIHKNYVDYGKSQSEGAWSIRVRFKDAKYIYIYVAFK